MVRANRIVDEDTNRIIALEMSCPSISNRQTNGREDR